MDQDQLRYVVAAITLLLGVWMLFFGVRLHLKGVKANAISEPHTNWMQRLLIAGAGILDLYLLLRAPAPVLDDYVKAAPSPVPILAIAILLLGAAIIIAAQAGMGSSWRVGVPKDANHVDALVTSGLHSVSRNPVYLGVMIFLIGALCAAPGPLTIAAVIASFLGLTKIIRQEERYLQDRFSEQYNDYASRVRRWI